MENDEIRNALHEADRAAASPWIDYPPTPVWQVPAMGLWSAAFVLVWRLDGPLFAVSVVSLLLLEAAFIRWMSQRHGAMPFPGHGTPPPEIGRVYRGYFVGTGVVVLVVGIVWWLLGVVTAGVATFLLVTGGLAVYEHTYSAAAARVRDRLS